LTERRSATRQGTRDLSKKLGPGHHCIYHNGQWPPGGHHRHRLLCAYIIARDVLVATLIYSLLVHTVSLAHAPTMVILIFDKQLVDDCITGLPIGDPLDMQWPHHSAHQMQSGSHEKTPCLQQQFSVVTRANRDAVDISGMPPYLRRKPTRHDGMA
jgi:hypothetical protein